jgi:hypothetical protein
MRGAFSGTFFDFLFNQKITTNKLQINNEKKQQRYCVEVNETRQSDWCGLEHKRNKDDTEFGVTAVKVTIDNRRYSQTICKCIFKLYTVRLDKISQGS